MMGLGHVFIGARTIAGSRGRRSGTTAEVPEGMCRHEVGRVVHRKAQSQMQETRGLRFFPQKR